MIFFSAKHCASWSICAVEYPDEPDWSSCLAHHTSKILTNKNATNNNFFIGFIQKNKSTAARLYVSIIFARAIQRRAIYL
jgi:hypothetical protein